MMPSHIVNQSWRTTSTGIVPGLKTLNSRVTPIRGIASKPTDMKEAKWYKIWKGYAYSGKASPRTHRKLNGREEWGPPRRQYEGFKEKYISMKAKHLAMVSKEGNFMRIQVGIEDGRAIRE